MFKRLGAKKVINSDELAHEVFRPGHPIGKKLKSKLRIKGFLSRAQIAKEVFSNPKKRKKLETLIHPYVFQRIRSEVKWVPKGIVILEVPLLFETGFNRFCDVTITVLSGKRNIMNRLSKKGFDKAHVHARLGAQLSETEKKRRSDFSVRNFGSKGLLAQETKSVWRKLKSILNEN